MRSSASLAAELPWGARSRIASLEQRRCGRRLWCATGAAVQLEVLVVWSFVYLALRHLLELLVLC